MRQSFDTEEKPKGFNRDILLNAGIVILCLVLLVQTAAFIMKRRCFIMPTAKLAIPRRHSGNMIKCRNMKSRWDHMPLRKRKYGSLWAWNRKL